MFAFIPRHVQYIPSFKTKRELCFQREIVSSQEREIKYWTTVLDEFGHGCGRFN